MDKLFIDPEVLKFINEIENNGNVNYFYCQTEEERHAFLDAMDSLGYIWNSGDRLDTFNSGTYLSPIGYMIHNGDMHISCYKEEYRHYDAVAVSDLIDGEPCVTDENLLEILGC